jgi:hypothetical protein
MSRKDYEEAISVQLGDEIPLGEVYRYMFFFSFFFSKDEIALLTEDMDNIDSDYLNGILPILPQQSVCY